MKHLFVLLLLSTIGLQGIAQSYPVQIIVGITPPYSYRLDDYVSANRGKIFVSLVNTSQNTLQLKFKGNLSSDAGIKAGTKSNFEPAQPIIIGPNSTKVLNESEIAIFNNPDAYAYSGVDINQVQRLGVIPEGNYSFCVTAYDFSTPGYNPANQLSAEEPQGCTNFNVTYLDPPIIISVGNVQCGDAIANEEIDGMGGNQLVTFSWNPPPGADILATSYKFEMAEVNPANLNPNDAISNAAMSNGFFYSGTVAPGAPLLVFDNSKPHLVKGQKYAFRVQAVNQSQYYNNKGYSDVCTFNYGIAAGAGVGNAGLTLEQIYPTNGSVIPFNSIPIIVKFSPYNNNFTGCITNIQLRTGGVSTENYDRFLNWPRGPLATQQQVTGFGDLTQEQSQHLVVNEFMDDGHTRVDFRRGKEYNLDVTATMNFAAHASPDVHGFVRGSFQTGMPVPDLQAPLNNSTVPPGRIEMSFFTGNPPEHITPPFAVTQAKGAHVARFINCPVRERFLLQVARTNAFNDADIIDTFSREVGRTYDLLSESETDIKHDLYKLVDHSINITDTGRYYWRVLWYNDPISSDKRQTYNVSPVWNFRISRDRAVVQDTIRRTPDNCLASCVERFAGNEQRVAVNTLAIGQTVHFGNFELTITRLTNASSPYSGEGTVAVPFLGCNVRVEFSGLEVNAHAFAFNGSAHALNDAPDVVPNTWLNIAANFGAITDRTADEINRLLITGGRLASMLARTQPMATMGMPLGLDNNIAGVRTTIAIVGMNFTSEMGTLNALANIDVPELNGWLSLGAADICFSPFGINTGQGKLYMPTEKRLDFSPDVQMAFTAPNFPAHDSGTYVSWDCQGFKALHLKGEFRFSRNLLLPDSADGLTGGGRVNARFEAMVQRSRNWMLQLDMDPFQINGVPEWGFSPRNIIFDFNNLANFAEMSFPDGYEGDRSALWKGFFMKELSVRLPARFHRFSDPNHRVEFAAHDILIDRTGFSGLIRGTNILMVNDGNVDGWAFGIDSVHIHLVCNGFRSAGLSGNLKIPISSQPVDYRMILNRADGNIRYECLVQPRDTLRATIISPATLHLTPTSRISITAGGGNGFLAQGILDGDISVEGRIDPIGTFDFRGIRFERLTVQSRAPYVDGGHFTFASPGKRMGGFNVSVDSIQFASVAEPSLFEFNRGPGTRVGLFMKINVELINGQRNTFAAQTRVGFIALIQPPSADHPFSVNFSGLNCNSIDVHGSTGPVSIRGGIQFYASHPIYGEGVRGFVSAEFKPTVSVNAVVQFGTANSHPYFFIDGSARMTPSLPLIPGAMNIKGFGGAVYYGMRFAGLPRAVDIGSNSRPDISALGTTASGGTVTPDANQGFGFMARMYLVPPTGTTYKAMVELGADFSASGGVSSMRLNGDLIAMSNTDDIRQAKVAATMRMNYDLERSIFDGQFVAFININGVVRGRNDDNSVGLIHMYASPSTWFIKIGTPSNRVGVNFNLGPLSMESNAYLMLGKSLDPMPAMPDEICALIHEPISSQRSQNVINGDGFCLGATFRQGLPRTEFLMFYAQLQTIIGFDVAVLQTPGVACDNLPGIERGADGWYSEGQLYAYFNGKLGIHVDVWFANGDFDIFSAQVAAAIQGGFPNPNWFKGNVACNYRILGGLVQGACNFEVKVGERCVPALDNALGGIELVTQLTPTNGATDVDCGIEPQAVFNIPPGHQDTISYLNANGDRVYKTFRVMYRNFSLTGNGLNINQPLFGNAVSGGAIPGRNNDGSIVSLQPQSFLKDHSTYTVSITAYIEELQNGAWVQSRNRDNSLVQRTYTSQFTTGAYPNTINDDRILHTYPYRNQRFLLQDECRSGMIQLRQDMSFLFEQHNPEMIDSYYVDILPTDGSAPPVRVNLAYGSNAHTIYYRIPQLQNGKIYAVRVVAKSEFRNRGLQILADNPLNIDNPLNMNNPRYSNTTRVNRGETQVVVRTAEAPGTQVRNHERIMYIYYFQTSQFNTLSAKMATARNFRSRQTDVFNLGYGMLHGLNINFSCAEKFDVFDVNGELYRPQGGNRDAQARAGGLVEIYHVASGYDQYYRTRQIYDLYQAAVRQRIINATRNLGGFVNISMPNISPLTDRYNVDILQPLAPLSRNEILPSPPVIGGGIGFGAIGDYITCSYGGYQNAHVDKNTMATAITQIITNPFMLGIYSSSTTPADRGAYQELLNYRNYYAYPQCQNLTFGARFIYPFACARDGGNQGTSSNFNLIYNTPCGDGPR